VRFAEKERTARLADAVLKHLGLKPNQLDALQALPLETLSAAVVPAQATLPRPKLPLLDRYNFGPVIDGAVLPAHPFDPGAPAISDDIPVMVGDTKDEAAIFLAPDNAVWERTLGGEEALKRLAAVAGAWTGPLAEYYVRRNPPGTPNATAADRLITALTASNFGVRTQLLAERKAARGQVNAKAAPVYMYDFAWETPAFGGRLKSCHSVEVPFVFDTLHVIGDIHEKKGAQALADKVSTAWATFARSGNPNHKGLPEWPAYEATRHATMTFDDDCKVVDDPDGEVRPVWQKVATGS